jgi:Flp pilus assembly protein TadD
VAEYQNDLASTCNNLGVVLAGQGKLAEAQKEYQQALALQHRLVEAYPARPLYRQELIRTLNNLGNLAGARGDAEAAISYFREAIRLDPRNALSHNHLGVALQNRGDSEGAIRCYREAIRLEPRLTAAHANLSHLQTKKREAAYRALMNIAQAAMKAKRYADALKDFDEALKLKPDDPAIRLCRKVAAEAIQEARDNPRLGAYQDWMKKARAALAAKKYAEALKGFTEALKIKPGDAEAMKGRKTASDALNK